MKPMETTIDIKQVSFSYYRDNPVFQDFSLTVLEKEWTVVTGNNGSGKTTLTKLIMGIIKPDFGCISLFGRDVKALSLGQIGSMIGYAYQYPERQLFAVTVQEELTFAPLLRGEDPIQVNKRAEELLEAFELDKLRNSNPSSLSFGEKRRLAVAAVLMNKPRFLILDEPTASLDAQRIFSISGLLNQLKQAEIGGLIVSHDRSFIEAHGQRFITLDKGGIIRDER